MKLSLFASAAVAGAALVSAQDSSVQASASASASASSSKASSASPSSSNLIPSTISTTCRTFLTDLNADATLATCITPLLSLTASAANTSSSPSNTTSLTSNLKKLCSAPGCTATTLRSKLTQFYGNCTAELNGGADGSYDETVRGMYDILYVVHPLKEVVCTEDGASGEYCVTALSANLTTAAGGATSQISTNATIVANYVLPQDEQPEHIAAQYLSIVYSPSTNPTFAKRAPSSSSSSQSVGEDPSMISYPNSTTYRNTNLPYLFIQPNSAPNVLCSTCASAVFAAYASWEVNTPYALGLLASPILGGQSELWAGAEATCGRTWTGKIETAALGAAGSEDAAGSGASGLLSAGAKERGLWGSMAALVVVGAGMVLAV